MKIEKVTITGADDKTPIRALEKLSLKYPFVEWGILFSKSKRGENRYPTERWISNILKKDLNLSAHFCGAYSRSVLDGGNYSLLDVTHLYFNRIQLNHDFRNTTDEILQTIFRRKLKGKVIFQWNDNTKYSLDQLIYEYRNPDIELLYDSSGGLGKELGYIYKPIPNFFTGYAGGISPLNIDSILEQLTNLPNDDNIWIDMESGVRTDDALDLDKVEFILEKCSRLIL